MAAIPARSLCETPLPVAGFPPAGFRKALPYRRRRGRQRGTNIAQVAGPAAHYPETSNADNATAFETPTRRLVPRLVLRPADNGVACDGVRLRNDAKDSEDEKDTKDRNGSKDVATPADTTHHLLLTGSSISPCRGIV